MERVLCLSLAVLMCGGCVYYDHRWVQERRARKERERQAEAQAQLASGGPPVEARRVGRVRIHASPAYRQEHFDWTREVRAVVEDANPAWIRATGTRLEVVAIEPWEGARDSADLEDCLVELKDDDPGDDVDWVIGLVGSVPRVSQRFDDLGMASLPGKHVVLRGFADVQELDALAQEFPGTGQEKLDAIYRARKRHKAHVVLLHELAHTLGVLHVRDAGTFMHPAYHHEASHFDEVSAKLLFAGTRDRFEPRGTPHAYKLAFLDMTDSPAWQSRERKELIAQLKALSASPQQASPDEASVARSSQPPGHPLVLADSDASLAQADVDASARRAYDEAVQALVEGDDIGAWRTLEPLIDLNPGCRAIQHLACGLAMQLGQVQRARQSCPRVAED